MSGLPIPTTNSRLWLSTARSGSRRRARWSAPCKSGLRRWPCEGRIGAQFHGVITGASDKGVYVRVFDPPVEGRVIRDEAGLDVGDTVNVVLLHTDPQHAFIDFGRV